MMITFEHPTRLILLLCIIPLIYLQHGWKNRSSVLLFPFSIWRQERFFVHQLGVRILLASKAVFFWGALVLLILSLAGPSYAVEERVFLERGADIMIVLDESPSMAAMDFQPENRFEAARSVIRKFVQNRENNSIGLVSFALESALRVPLTLDYAHFLSKLNSMSIMDLGDGTALGMGIATGLLHLRPREAADKVMILLTDGKENAGAIRAEAAASVAEQMGVRIYVIGIGHSEETYIEFTNPRTGVRYEGTLEGGFDESTLKTIAARSGGTYFHATNPETLSSIFKMIDSLEQRGERYRLDITKVPLHRTFAIWGLFSLIGYFVVRVGLLREIL